MGRVHLEAVQRVESVEAAAIFGRNDDATARLAAAFSVPKATSDYRELLRDPAIDAPGGADFFMCAQDFSL